MAKGSKVNQEQAKHYIQRTFATLKINEAYLCTDWGLRDTLKIHNPNLVSWYMYAGSEDATVKHHYQVAAIVERIRLTEFGMPRVNDGLIAQLRLKGKDYSVGRYLLAKDVIAWIDRSLCQVLSLVHLL